MIKSLWIYERLGNIYLQDMSKAMFNVSQGGFSGFSALRIYAIGAKDQQKHICKGKSQFAGAKNKIQSTPCGVCMGSNNNKF
jgi:hypothetical protein